MAEAAGGRDKAGEWLVEEDEHARKASQARGKLVADVAVSIERTLKSFRQFGVRHKTSEAFVVDGVKRIGAFAELHGELPLSIVGSDVLYEGESVYSEPDLRASYPFLFFRDGVQRVVLEGGLLAEEYRTLCQLLRDQSLQGAHIAVDDDLVTLLWDADLPHVRYVVNDQFKQEDLPAELEAQRRRVMEQIKSEAFERDIPSEVAARFARLRTSKEVERAKEDLDVARAWEDGHRILADERARAALVAQIDPDDVLLRKFLEIVFLEILRHAGAGASFKARIELVALVRDFAIEATRRDRLPEAIGVLRALGDLARGAGEQGRIVAQEIVAAIATEEVLKGLVEQLQIADEAGTQQLLTFLALVPPKESRRLLPMLPSLSDAPRRRAVCVLLAARLGDDLATIGDQLRRAEDPLALDLVFLLRQSKSARAKVELLAALDHPSSRVRRNAYDAIRAHSSAGDPTLVGASLLVLEDADADLRREGLMALPRAFDADVARRLRLLISRDHFDGWDYYDKRRAYLVYAAACGKRAAKELGEVLTTSGIFSGEALEDRRCAAAFALASLGDELQVPILEGESKRLLGGKRVKEACEAAIAMLKFKKPIDAGPEPSMRPAAIAEPTETIDVSSLPSPIWEDGPARTSLRPPGPRGVAP